MKRFHNYSRRIPSKSDDATFAWCIFCDEPTEILKAISAVEYTLHPTFPDPVRRIEDRSSRFALDSTGWGTFRVLIRIFDEDGNVEKAFHDLQLKDDDWPRGKVLEQFSKESDRAIFRGLMDSRFEFRRLSTLSKLASISVSEASSALMRLHDQGFVRKVHYDAPFDEDLWGATAKVGLRPSKED